MKKILLVFLAILFTFNCANADCDYECVKPYDLNNKFRSVMSAVTGFNAIVENRIESVLKKEIFKIASADNLKIKVDSYSPKDLKNGIFKSMEVKGNNVVINGIHLTSLELKTLCDFNYIKESGKEIVFVEDMPMSFNVEMTSQDLNNTMDNSRYKKIIKDVNNLGQAYGGGLQISSAKVAIKNNKFYFIMALDMPFITKQPKMVVSADLKVKDGKIDYQNTRITSGFIKFDLKKFDFIMNYLNPLDFSINFIDNKDAKFKVKNLEIKDDTIYANGIIIIPKD